MHPDSKAHHVQAFDEGDAVVVVEKRRCRDLLGTCTEKTVERETGLSSATRDRNSSSTPGVSGVTSRAAVMASGESVPQENPKGWIPGTAGLGAGYQRDSWRILGSARVPRCVLLQML